MNTENHLQSAGELDNNTALNVVKARNKIKKKVKKAISRKIHSAPIGAPINDDSRANRPKRIPVGSQRRLSVPERSGFVRRWVNDIDDRIEMFKAAGYEIVADDMMPIGDQCSKDANPLGATRRKSVGRGRYAYLMQIPEEFYRQDQLNKIKRNMANQERAKRPKEIEGIRYGNIDIDHNSQQR
jgi:hypothetical protein